MDLEGAVFSGPGRIDFATTNAGTATDYFQNVYRTKMRFSGARDGLNYGHSRVDAGVFALDEVRLPKRMEVAQDPFNALLVIHVLAGRFEHHCAGVTERFTAGDVFVHSDPDLPVTAQLFNSHLQTSLLDLSMLAQVAATAPSRKPGPIRFTSFQPRTRIAAEQWQNTTNHVAVLLANTEAVAQPLIRGAAARLMAAAVLSTFPNTALVEPTDQDRRDATHLAVRRAVAFIEQHPDRDISVADIAAAAHVSIRAVQLAFRRDLDTTPMRYLRDVRLDLAHRDLLAADPSSGVTVTDIATRWGFYSLSRFSAHYRRSYGVAPHETLHRA